MSYIYIVLFANVVLVAGQADYCKLCKDHVACNATGKFHRNCQNATTIPFKKCWIMRKHNEWRNEVAGGNVQNLKPACRMAYLQWDDELAVLALQNVVQCKVNHDKCVKTLQFPRVLQNLGTINYDGNISHRKTAIENILTNWYREVNNVRQKDLQTNKVDPTHKSVKFLTMMEDRITHVGCAAATYKHDNKQVILLTCNYGTRNIIGRPVYEVCNKPGKMCDLNSLQYKNLCSRGEELIKGQRKVKPIKLRFYTGMDPQSPQGTTSVGTPYSGRYYLGSNGVYYRAYNALAYPFKANYPQYYTLLYPNNGITGIPGYDPANGPANFINFGTNNPSPDNNAASMIPFLNNNNNPANFAPIPDNGNNFGNMISYPAKGIDAGHFVPYPINSINPEIVPHPNDFSGNDQNKINNHDNLKDANNFNEDNSNTGDVFIIITNSSVSGTIDTSNKNVVVIDTDELKSETSNAETTEHPTQKSKV